MATPGTTPLLHAVTRPRRTWQGLGAGAKLAVYSRLSLQLLVVVCGVGVIVLALVGRSGDGPTITSAQLLLVAVPTIVLTVMGLWITELRPEFNTSPRAEHGRLLAGAAVLVAAIWAVGTAFYVLGDARGALTGLLLLCTALSLAPLCVLPWFPWRWMITLVLSTVTAVVTWSELQWWPMFWSTLLLSTSTLSAWTVNIAKELERSRLTESALQVSEERLRFAQELHDTLGQRLAAVSIKAELARALAARGDDRLDDELAELQSLVRDSTTEMREVIDGYRTVTLASEIQGARDLLHSTGVRFTVEGDPDALAPALREPAAWLVREGTTNVVRHSAATWVTLTFTADTVTMLNDGVESGIDRLSGLAGIRHRVEPLGATLVAERDGNLFRVTLRLPEQP